MAPYGGRMKKEQAEFGARLREALLNAGLGEESKELADLVSAKGGDAVTPQAAHHWIRGKTIPRRRNLRALAALLNVTPEWLLGEEGAARKSRVGEPRGSSMVGVHDQQAIDTFLSLPPARRQIIRSLLRALAEKAAG